MDSLLSFPVGLFHPLQHAGLSRRSPSGRPLVHNRQIRCAPMNVEIRVATFTSCALYGQLSDAHLT
jgi:hypothetical protein